MADGTGFRRYIGIDYSGAQTPTSSLKGLRVYAAAPEVPPDEVQPPASARKYWTRRGIFEWLVGELAEDQPTLVGIDHAFSFPLRYFQQHALPLEWAAFLEDFHRHWPADEDNVYLDFIREGQIGDGRARWGDPHWRRLTELRARAKSAFHFDVQGSVAKSTHAGVPWLLHLRRRFDSRLHFWPFDGWHIPPGQSAVVEVYPALWSPSFPQDGRDAHQHDAYSIAAWMRQSDFNGALSMLWNPHLNDDERRTAAIEGWILGVA